MYQQYLPDRRLADRAGQLQQAMVARQSACVATLSRSWAEQIAYYRLLGNPRVQEGELIEALGARTVRALQQGSEPAHVLAIQDTTQMNFQLGPRQRRPPPRGLGVIGDGLELTPFGGHLISSVEKGVHHAKNETTIPPGVP